MNSQSASGYAATALAHALDRDEFATAEAMLAAGCVYESPYGLLEGPAAIMASYRGNAESAVNKFDRIEYESRVDAIDDASARITYFDRITHKGKTHEFSCCQIVTVGDDGVIVRIVHEEIPGKREALNAFYAEIGVDPI